MKKKLGNKPYGGTTSIINPKKVIQQTILKSGKTNRTKSN